MSSASWISRLGITLFHKNYNLLKVWWQGAIACMLIYGVLLLFHYLAFRYLVPMSGKLLQLVALVLAVCSFLATYNDFHHQISHRFLGHLFHMGVYYFWAGWVFMALFFLVSRSGYRPKNLDSNQQIIV